MVYFCDLRTAITSRKRMITVTQQARGNKIFTTLMVEPPSEYRPSKKHFVKNLKLASQFRSNAALHGTSCDMLDPEDTELATKKGNTNVCLLEFPGKVHALYRHQPIEFKFAQLVTNKRKHGGARLLSWHQVSHHVHLGSHETTRDLSPHPQILPNMSIPVTSTILTSFDWPSGTTQYYHKHYHNKTAPPASRFPCRCPRKSNNTIARKLGQS